MRFDTEYGYESLALNIVIQAAKDYRKALRDLRKDPDDFDANVNMDDCERFSVRSGVKRSSALIRRF